ncbi:Prohibitin-2 [Hortaea werneckii]|nr:Prohibitin-2 [Hortaea werneckii]
MVQVHPLRLLSSHGHLGSFSKIDQSRVPSPHDKTFSLLYIYISGLTTYTMVDRSLLSLFSLFLPRTVPSLFILMLTSLANIQAQALRVEVDLVLGLLQDTRDVLGVLELPEVDVRVALLDSVADELGRARLTLRPYYHGLLLLPRFVDHEGGALGFLLRDLLGFYGCGEFGGEGELLFVANGMIVPNQLAHILTLSDELTRVELCHDALQHLVDNARQDSLVVVLTQRPVNLGQSVDAWAGENTAGDVDHLKILGAGEGGDGAGFGADIVVDRRLEPGQTDMGTFGVDFLADTAETGVFDGAVTTIDCAHDSVLKASGSWKYKVLTVEQGIVEEPYATETKQQQPRAAESSSGTGCAATAAESLLLIGQSLMLTTLLCLSDVLLQVRPRLSRIATHVGGWFLERPDRCRGREWMGGWVDGSSSSAQMESSSSRLPLGEAKNLEPPALQPPLKLAVYRWTETSGLQR